MKTANDPLNSSQTEPPEEALSVPAPHTCPPNATAVCLYSSASFSLFYSAFLFFFFFFGFSFTLCLGYRTPHHTTRRIVNRMRRLRNRNSSLSCCWALFSLLLLLADGWKREAGKQHTRKKDPIKVIEYSSKRFSLSSTNHPSFFWLPISLTGQSGTRNTCSWSKCVARRTGVSQFGTKEKKRYRLMYGTPSECNFWVAVVLLCSLSKTAPHRPSALFIFLGYVCIILQPCLFFIPFILADTK